MVFSVFMQEKGEGGEWVIYEGGQCTRQITGNGIERRGCCCICSHSFVYLCVLLVYKTTFLIRDSYVPSQTTHLGPAFLNEAPWEIELQKLHVDLKTLDWHMAEYGMWTQNPAAFQPVLAGDESHRSEGGRLLGDKDQGVKGDGSCH